MQLRVLRWFTRHGLLKRLIRYCARGPLALERLHAPAGIGALSSPEARLVYRLPEPDVQRTQASFTR